jgi:hypothetical protein
MAIAYNWTCTACGVANVAGVDVCAKCGSNAITSAEEIDQRAKGKPAALPKYPPLPQPQKFLAACCLFAVIVGAILERFTFPPMTVWYASIALMVAGGVPLWVIFTRNKRLAK